MIIAPAIKTKEGKIFAGRKCHGDIIKRHPTEFRHAEQGFITDTLDFVDRIRGLEIAKQCNQIMHKHNTQDILMSEDIFS
jgi:hypothetical protein